MRLPARIPTTKASASIFFPRPDKHAALSRYGLTLLRLPCFMLLLFLSLSVVRSSGPVAGLKILPDQNRFVTGSFDRGVRIWDLRVMTVSATHVCSQAP